MWWKRKACGAGTDGQPEQHRESPQAVQEQDGKRDRSSNPGRGGCHEPDEPGVGGIASRSMERMGGPSGKRQRLDQPKAPTATGRPEPPHRQVGDRRRDQRPHPSSLDANDHPRSSSSIDTIQEGGRPGLRHVDTRSGAHPGASHAPTDRSSRRLRPFAKNAPKPGGSQRTLPHQCTTQLRI